MSASDISPDDPCACGHPREDHSHSCHSGDLCNYWTACYAPNTTCPCTNYTRVDIFGERVNEGPIRIYKVTFRASATGTAYLRARSDEEAERLADDLDLIDDWEIDDWEIDDIQPTHG